MTTLGCFFVGVVQEPAEESAEQQESPKDSICVQEPAQESAEQQESPKDSIWEQADSP